MTTSSTTFVTVNTQRAKHWWVRLAESPARRWVLAAAAICAALLVLVASRFGPGASPDSLSFHEMAEHFELTGRLSETTMYAPGLPVILGVSARLGIDIQVAAVIWNLLAVLVTVLLSYLLARDTLRSRPWGLAVAVIVAISPCTVRVFSRLWTEPMFTALTLLILVGLLAGVRAQRLPWWQWALASGMVSVACTVRYIGMTLIPMVVLAVLLAKRDQPRASSFAAATCAGALASVGLVTVVARNLGLGDPPLGPRTPSDLHIAQVLGFSVRTVGGYVAPYSMLVLAIAVGFFLSAFLAYSAYLALGSRRSDLMVLTAFVVIYWVALWYTAATTALDYISERFTSPIHTPMLILFAYGVRHLANRPAKRPRLARPALAWVGAGLLGITLLGSIAMSLNFTRDAALNGVGYNSAAIRTSPLAAAVADLPVGAGVATTDPGVVSWVSGREPALWLPRSDHYSPWEATQESLHRLREGVAQGEIQYLAFFDRNEDSLPPEAIEQAGVPLSLVAAFADGVLYRVAE